MMTSSSDDSPVSERPSAPVRFARQPRQAPWTGRGRLVAGALAVVVLGALAAVATRARSTAAPSRPRVDVVGDSLVHQSASLIRDRLDDGGFDAEIVGLPSQSLASEAVRSRIDALDESSGAVLVVATAANDAGSNAEIEGERLTAPNYRAAISDLLYRFDDRCVVVVNARDLMNRLYQPERAVVLNTELATLAQRGRPNLVVVDWAARSRELPASAFSGDQLHFGDPVDVEHPDSVSARAYADAIMEGVRRCPER